MTTDITTITKGKHLNFVRRGSWEFVTRPGITGIVLVMALTNTNEILLVEQYRPPLDATIIELCAGLAGDVTGQEDEPLEDAARRELIEECGYDATTFELLTEGPPAQGLCNEYLTFFKATGLTRISEGGGDHTEDITVHHVPLETIDQWLNAQRTRGKMVDPKIYTALYFLK